MYVCISWNHGNIPNTGLLISYLLALENLFENSSPGSMLQRISGFLELCLSRPYVTPAHLGKCPRVLVIFHRREFPLIATSVCNLQAYQFVCYTFKYATSICSNINEDLWFYILPITGYQNFQTWINSCLQGRESFIILINRWWNCFLEWCGQCSRVHAETVACKQGLDAILLKYCSYSLVMPHCHHHPKFLRGSSPIWDSWMCISIHMTGKTRMNC